MAFKNQDLAIFKKVCFEPINREFLVETTSAIDPLMKIQIKYKKLDNDTFFNEYKDSLIASYLNFELINTQKHGFDAKKSINEDIYLEVKQVSLSANSWGATFNDTNQEKAQAFMDEKMFLEVGVWQGLSELKFIVYGQNPDIGDYLLNRILTRKPNSRSTQNISLKDLVVKYGFFIMPVIGYQETQNLLIAKYGNQDWWKDAIQSNI